MSINDLRLVKKPVVVVVKQLLRVAEQVRNVGELRRRMHAVLEKECPPS